MRYLFRCLTCYWCIAQQRSTHNNLLSEEVFTCVARRCLVDEALPRWRVGESNFGLLPRVILVYDSALAGQCNVL
jgi:hypothetical protein